MKKYLGYIRVSTDEQVEGFGLNAQRASVESYAKALGYELEDVIADEGYSGSTMDRPGIQRVLETMRGCDYAGVIVYKLDRISRSLKDILVVHDDIFVPCGSGIISVKEQFDTTTAAGKLFFQMLGGFAEFERSVINERMMSGKEQKAKQGKFAGGSAPFGYDLVNGELVINEEQAEWVRTVFQMRAEGVTMQAIADTLNNEGVQTKRGAEWSRKQVMDMLHREDIYRGMYKHGEVVTVGQHQPILA